ncbi:Bug family tripartite tricarboxylate transporter substrate binding protein [Azohydromonas aeria]|uniref:Bug family tripartite tricarboxylate transporter substrate binding protein n=1 Tax=Azohydromonas aeria TaxID=2590212 RepID=UPI0012F9731A|nr:tripartite tricarboxylate transporter substrate-binding protein [Azohydromonas aeria]
MTHRRTLLARASAVACLTLLASLPAAAQTVPAAPAAPASPAPAAGTWPVKPVTIIVPFPAGGGTDTFARPLFAAMGKNTGRQFVIDNKGGAGGTVGAGLAARLPADGHNFFMGGVHHAIAPAMYPKLDYNLESDFVPVGLVSNVPQVVVVNAAKGPAADLPGLLKLLRQNPGKLNYGSAGNGTSHHLAGELFKLQTKTFITHIPYRGAGPALQDLMAGQVDMMFDGLGSSAGHIRSGRLKGLAVAGERRAPGFPDIPTARELGVPDYVVSTWYGIWAPKGTPREAIERMQAEMKKALESAELKATWTGLGSETPNLWGNDFSAWTARETKRWAEVVKASGARLE